MRNVYKEAHGYPENNGDTGNSPRKGGWPPRVEYRAHPDTKFSALKMFITLEGQEG